MTTITARLITTLAAPLDPAEADAPAVLRWPDQRLLVQRGDTEFVAYDLDELISGAGEPTVTRFPAPWPRRFGTATVAPRRNLAVFAGVHALWAVDATGAVRWEIRHACWEVCGGTHVSFDEYAHCDDHQSADRGSAVFSADGSIVWAHVRGPLPGDGEEVDASDQWLVVDAADGQVLGRVDAETAAQSSRHVPTPLPCRMALGISEGQNGQPVLWGRWNGGELTLDRAGEDDDRILLAVSPSGDHFLTVTPDQDALGLHQVTDGSVVAELEVETVAARYRVDHGEVWWDFAGSFLDAETVITGTTDAELGTELHWLVDTERMRVSDQISYPFPIAGSPGAVGDGTWSTVSEAGDGLHLWTRQPRTVMTSTNTHTSTNANTNVITHPVFGQLTPGGKDPCWEGRIEWSGRALQLDLTVSDPHVRLELLDGAARIAADVGEFDRLAQAAMRQDAESAGLGLYMRHHLNAFDHAELSQLFGVDSPDLVDVDRFAACLHLRRIGLSPDAPERYAVFDYSIGDALTDYLVVVTFDSHGEVRAVDMES